MGRDLLCFGLPVVYRPVTKLATDVTTVLLKDTGHWVLEERPKDTTEALLKFL